MKCLWNCPDSRRPGCKSVPRELGASVENGGNSHINHSTRTCSLSRNCWHRKRTRCARAACGEGGCGGPSQSPVASLHSESSPWGFVMLVMGAKSDSSSTEGCHRPFPSLHPVPGWGPLTAPPRPSKPAALGQGPAWREPRTTLLVEPHPAQASSCCSRHWAADCPVLSCLRT